MFDLFSSLVNKIWRILLGYLKFKINGILWLNIKQWTQWRWVCFQLPHTPLSVSNCAPVPWKVVSHSWASPFVTMPATCSSVPSTQGATSPAQTPSGPVMWVHCYQVNLTGLSDSPSPCQARKGLSFVLDIGRPRGNHLYSYVYESPIAAITKYHTLNTTQMYYLMVLESTSPN